jgi:hypothetical protein
MDDATTLCTALCGERKPDEPYVRDNLTCIEVSQPKKRGELKKRLGEIFGRERVSGPNYTKSEKWSVKYEYREIGKEMRCWCTSKIQHIYFLKHADFPAVAPVVIGSKCADRFFKTNPLLKESASKQRSSFRARQLGRICKQCTTPLIKFRRKIQYEEGFCDEACQFDHDSKECCVETCSMWFVPREEWMSICRTCYSDRECIMCSQMCAPKKVCGRGPNKGRAYSKCGACGAFSFL